jgi:HPr Serine kinase C-terminal domain
MSMSGDSRLNKEDVHVVFGKVSRCDGDFHPYARVLPLRKTFFPLGFPVEIASDSETVLHAAHQSWQMFRPIYSCGPLLVELEVNEDDTNHALCTPTCRIRDHFLVSMIDAKSVMVSDLEQGYALGRVSRSVAQSQLHLRYHFLEAAVLSMISTLRATALHSACVEAKGRGVLLCGDSGAGKSSLAFAGARSGWRYISDDASYLVLHRTDRTVTGNCHQVRLRDSATQLFSELEDCSVTPRATGKPSIEISLKELPDIVTAESTQIDYIIFLNRHDTTVPGLYPISSTAASSYFQKSLLRNPLPDSTMARAFKNLLEAKIYELRYTELKWAITSIERLVSTGR